MTVTADTTKRVVLPPVKPGDRFDVRVSDDGAQIVFTKLIPAPEKELRPNKVRFVKENGRTVGVIERANFDEAALKQALTDFP